MAELLTRLGAEELLRLGVLTELLLRDGLLKLLRLGVDELRLGLLKLLRLGLLLLLRLGLEELRLGELNELLRLGLGLEERLTDGVLCPPPRLPPPPPGRWAKTGVKLSVKPTITIAITFEVFISLLLSCLFSVLFSIAKIDKKAGEISPAFNYFSKRLSDGASFGDLLRGCNQH